ncbi:helix-turn-helix domain-containing protein, partial [Mannheimia haemolytica]|nr:helix-turn-helix domain-containing protein [Mannheimia haemolytica]
MFYSNNPLIKHKTGLLNLAEELGNISQACKVMGMSRDTFYRYQQAEIHSIVINKRLS